MQLCIRSKEANKKACSGIFLNMLLLLYLEKIGKQACNHHGHNSRHPNAEVAHSAFYLAHFHSLDGSDRMRGSADGQTFGNWFVNPEDLADLFSSNISENTGDDNCYNRYRYEPAEFFRNADANGCSD